MLLIPCDLLTHCFNLRYADFSPRFYQEWRACREFAESKNQFYDDQVVQFPIQKFSELKSFFIHRAIHKLPHSCLGKARKNSVKFGKSFRKLFLTKHFQGHFNTCCLLPWRFGKQHLNVLFNLGLEAIHHRRFPWLDSKSLLYCNCPILSDTFCVYASTKNLYIEATTKNPKNPKFKHK